MNVCVPRWQTSLCRTARGLCVNPSSLSSFTFCLVRQESHLASLVRAGPLLRRRLHCYVISLLAYVCLWQVRLNDFKDSAAQV
ncbi:hypothetical protein BCV70DRAFT_35869 [Testicularia cyperi]|uniref:Uncharacterized protein n=1 Tax=Testicularia cyperi TaxID=1882483 RepID=A0A317XK55_9BASI|nr:hypothetical protein BCV70DRAFT_35869 [Testicularia cyperi]